MIINTNYRMGAFVDLCHCGCNQPCGYWQTSCPPSPQCCFPSCPSPCNPCQEHYCGHNNCCGNSCIDICLPKNALFFMAGYLISKKIN